MSIDIKYELPLWEEGKIPVGVDEAGRGPLAGPVVAACVALSRDKMIEGIDDSKSLSASKRVELCRTIKANCISYAVGIVENDEIDRINILQATLKAMKLAVTGLDVEPDMVYIDGNVRINMEIDQTTIVKGDKKCHSIAAASIIAKVTRDRIMKEMNNLYPNYMFDKHKGYPTKEHYEAIKKYGPCPIHRLSYKGVTNY